MRERFRVFLKHLLFGPVDDGEFRTLPGEVGRAELMRYAHAFWGRWRYGRTVAIRIVTSRSGDTHIITLNTETRRVFDDFMLVRRSDVTR